MMVFRRNLLLVSGKSGIEKAQLPAPRREAIAYS
jgi:hypothetical protein